MAALLAEQKTAELLRFVRSISATGSRGSCAIPWQSSTAGFGTIEAADCRGMKILGGSRESADARGEVRAIFEVGARNRSEWEYSRE